MIEYKRENILKIVFHVAHLLFHLLYSSTVCVRVLVNCGKVLVWDVWMVFGLKQDCGMGEGYLHWQIYSPGTRLLHPAVMLRPPPPSCSTSLRPATSHQTVHSYLIPRWPLSLSFLCSSPTVCVSLCFTLSHSLSLSMSSSLCVYFAVCAQSVVTICWSAQRGHHIMENGACQNVIALSLQRLIGFVSRSLCCWKRKLPIPLNGVKNQLCVCGYRCMKRQRFSLVLFIALHPYGRFKLWVLFTHKIMLKLSQQKKIQINPQREVWELCSE